MAATAVEAENDATVLATVAFAEAEDAVVGGVAR